MEDPMNHILYGLRARYGEVIDRRLGPALIRRGSGQERMLPMKGLSMRRLAHRLTLAPVLVLLVTARGLAQLPPAPTPTLGPTGACPAVASFQYDVSSIAGADSVQWQLRRGAPGQGFGAATPVDSGVELGTSGSVQRDLRAFDPVLVGERYFFRVRARQGNTNLTQFSSRLVFAPPSVSPDGMFTASPGANAGTLRLDWNLTGPIADCSDHIVSQIVKAGAAPFVAAEVGPSGTSTYDLNALGPGDYDVSLRAGFEGGGPEDAVGRESAPVPTTVFGLQPLEEVGVQVTIAVTSFQLQGGAATVPTSTPITLDATFTGGTPEQYKAALCGGDFNAAAYQSFPATPPPVLPGFATAGTRIVCFQVRRGLSSSATVRDTIQVVAPLAGRRFVPGAVTGVTGPAFTPVEIKSFRIQGGLPFVTVDHRVPLSFTVTGNPTEYRKASLATGSSACESVIESVPFQPLSASDPPTHSFPVSGRRFVCIQFRSAAQTSAVAKDDIRVIQPAVTRGPLGRNGTRDGTSFCGPGHFVGPPPPSDSFAVGVEVQAVDLIHAIALRCAALGPNGEHEFGVTQQLFGAPLAGLSQTILDCPSDQVLYGLQARFGDVIDNITILCGPWRSDVGSNGSATLEASAGGDGGNTTDDEVCPSPYAVREINVDKAGFLAGQYVGRITIVCTTPPEM
jgi:hypothetical protein